ncbi:MAG TPA: MBL fold metallo-hydrolase [Bryobacteraceae bacterium]|jgi:L-ascorbate metabolism protein UlaG (beta-lactamase superfamily)|nr:MBL fold metallo-hydrolase [Bryobacteraceae bacterium]
MLRRSLIGGAIGVAGLGTMAYRVAPAFWQQYARELGRPILNPSDHPDPRNWSDRGLYAAWLGHATMLLKVDGTIILTDPVFSDRVGLSLGPWTLGLKRLTAPALKLTGIPRPDLILLSHAHMDHFDLPSLRALEHPQTSVITASKTSDLLRVHRYAAVTELAWGERARAGAAEIRAFQVNHWGARMRTDTYRGYNGYLIEVGRYKILFGGDTANTGLFRNLRTSRPYDLAVMPIGAYNPWIYYHCTPEQAWRMGNDAGTEFFIPVHHQTFQLSREPFSEPIERFHQAAGPHLDRVALTRIGQEFHIT